MSDSLLTLYQPLLGHQQHPKAYHEVYILYRDDAPATLTTCNMFVEKMSGLKRSQSRHVPII